METEFTFSSTLPVMVYHRTPGETDWRELDLGPGVFRVPAGQQVMLRLRNIDDGALAVLAQELAGCTPVVFLNLSENRKVTGDGLELLRPLKWLTGLNLSSCALTDTGLVHLTAFTRLEHLNLSYCNRLTDLALKTIQRLNNLTFLDLQGCVKITNGGVARLRKRNLNIHR